MPSIPLCFIHTAFYPVYYLQDLQWFGCTGFPGEEAADHLSHIYDIHCGNDLSVFPFTPGESGMSEAVCQELYKIRGDRDLDPG